jgi:hypothetical protein
MAGALRIDGGAGDPEHCAFGAVTDWRWVHSDLSADAQKPERRPPLNPRERPELAGLPRYRR